MQHRTLSKYLPLIAALLLPLVLGACNTIEGVGEDIQAAGSKIDKTAEKEKTY
ncbi:MAG: entericidin A/B family lipoprotein [Gammaproteobacteria bacterium]